MLQVEQRRQRGVFRCRFWLGKQIDKGARHSVGQGQPPTGPAWDSHPPGAGTTDVGGQIPDTDQFQGPACEQELVARAQSRDKGLFHPAESATFQPAQLHGCVGCNGADHHAVSPCDRCVADTQSSVFAGLNPVVLGVGTEHVAPSAEKVQDPLPLRIRQPAVRVGESDLGEQILRRLRLPKAARHHMLEQDIDGRCGRVPCLDVTTRP